MALIVGEKVIVSLKPNMSSKVITFQGFIELRNATLMEGTMEDGRKVFYPLYDIIDIEEYRE